MVTGSYDLAEDIDVLLGVSMEPDSDQHELLDMEAAARTIPTQPSPAAVWRWCRKGILARDGQRIYLEHRRYGRRLFTTRAALDDFAKAVADVDTKYLASPAITQSAPKSCRDAARRCADIEAAIGRLREQGFFE